MCIHPICFQWQQSEIVWANLFAIMHQARDLAKQTQDCQLRWAIRIQSYKTYWVSQEAAHLWYDPLHFNPQFHTANIWNWSAIFSCVTSPVAQKLNRKFSLQPLSFFWHDKIQKERVSTESRNCLSLAIVQLDMSHIVFKESVVHLYIINHCTIQEVLPNSI